MGGKLRTARTLALAVASFAAVVLALTAPALGASRRVGLDTRWVSTRPLVSVDFVNATRGWVGGEGGVILRTTTGGKSWKVQRRYSSTGPSIYDLAFVSRRTGWAVGTYGYVTRTTDGGAHWRRQARGRFGENLTCARARSAGDCYACGGFASEIWDDAHPPYGAILHTTDGGRTWNQADFTGFCPMALDYVDATSAIAVGMLRHQTSPSTGYNTVAYTQTSDGVWWSVPQEIPNLAPLIGCPWGFDVRGNTCLIVGAFQGGVPQSGFALFSSDEMGSWSVVNFPTLGILTDAKLTSSATGYAVGMSNQVWKTADYGVSWSPQALATGGYASDLDFVSSSTGYVAGRWGPSASYGGRVYKTVNGGGRWYRKR